MQSKVLSLEYIDAIPEVKEPPRGRYVSCLRDAGPFGRLLWEEILNIEHASRMTAWQATVFEWYLRGFDNREISLVFQRSESTISEHLDKALIKALLVKHRGLLTVMKEEVGRRAVKEYIAEVNDISHIEHPDAAQSRAQYVEDLRKRGIKIGLKSRNFTQITETK